MAELKGGDLDTRLDDEEPVVIGLLGFSRNTDVKIECSHVTIRRNATSNDYYIAVLNDCSEVRTEVLLKFFNF